MNVLSPDEWGIMLLTLWVAARSVAFGLPIAVIVSWLLVRDRFFGRPMLDAVVHFPLVLPPVVIGWLLLIIFGVRGPIGSWLQSWFGARLVFTSTGASLACAVTSFPLMLLAIACRWRLWIPGLSRPHAHSAPARSIGFFNVTMPLAAPGVLVGGIVGFASCLGNFGAVITFAGSIPGQTQTLPLAIHAALQTPGGEGVATRLSLISVALAIGGLLASEAINRRLRLWVHQ